MSAPPLAPEPAIATAAQAIRRAAEAKKCWPCGCLHHALDAMEGALPELDGPPNIAAAMHLARDRLAGIKYDCLGCPVCYPAVALDALAGVLGDRLDRAATCPTEPVAERAGWPPLPGAYTVLRYRAPVAVCTLTDDGLAATLIGQRDPALAIVGTLATENLGIERLITNVLANPNLRFLLLCGADSRRAIGHLPGQSLLALSRSGLDERGRIIGAAGKRPVLRNLERRAIEHFRDTVAAVDLIGVSDVATILASARDCAGRNPGPAEPFKGDWLLTPIAGELPQRLIPDPAGYFVIYADRARDRLVLEHFTTEGVLDALIEGRTAAALYSPAIEHRLLSRLDHAAYLGRELARAEVALHTGEPYIQDAAPTAEPAPCATECGCRDAPGPSTIGVRDRSNRDQRPTTGEMGE